MEDDERTLNYNELIGLSAILRAEYFQKVLQRLAVVLALECEHASIIAQYEILILWWFVVGTFADYL